MEKQYINGNKLIDLLECMQDATDEPKFRNYLDAVIGVILDLEWEEKQNE